MKRVIDYRAAAERLLNILAARATEQNPLAASELVYLIFVSEELERWKDDETRRRRVRDAVDQARELLKERRQDIRETGTIEASPKPYGRCNGCGDFHAADLTTCPVCGITGPRSGGPAPTYSPTHPINHRSGLVADGRGYWLSVDSAVLSWYAQRREITGKQNMAAAGNAKRTAAAVHQPSLFSAPPEWRMR